MKLTKRRSASLKLWMGVQPNVSISSKTDLIFSEETIPIRFYLPGVDGLGPSFNNVNNKFSVIYLLNLLIIDAENQKYFKNNEITLWRKGKKSKKVAE